MRSEEKQKELNNMTDDEKRKRTTLLNYMKTWDFVEETSYWYIVNNRYPHKDRWAKQLVVWLKDKYKMSDVDSNKYMDDLRRIRKSYSDMNIVNHWDKYKSVKFREHRHLFNEK